MTTAKLSEGVLIEISQRLRHLEEAWENADARLARTEEQLRCRSVKADADKAAGTITYETFSRRFGQAQDEVKAIADIREAMERALEACRDDMAMLQDCARALMRIE